MAKGKKRTFHSKRKTKKLSGRQLQKALTDHFSKNTSKSYSLLHLYKVLSISNSKDELNHALSILLEKGFVKMTKADHFKYKKPKGRSKRNFGRSIEGVVDTIRSGAAYIIADSETEDIYVAAKNLRTAIHGDIVEIEILDRPRGRKPEGIVTRIVKRNRTDFIGSLVKINKRGYVVPHGRFSGLEIVVDHDSLEENKNGDIVTVHVTDWPKARNQFPHGIITENLGQQGSHDIEMKTILLNNGFGLQFSDEAMELANQMEIIIDEEVLELREDFRGVLTITIDPDDAKDFDDALSYRQLENGRIEIGVHIADVTHFLEEETILDKEAFGRSTSVYLVDRVLPMLPEKISNNLCSLVPNEDRFTFSAIFEFDDAYKIVARRFAKTIIHSDRRFTYTEAQEIIENPQGPFAESLKQMNDISLHLRKMRYKEGSIAFETEEVRFKLDENGDPKELYVKERKDAHLMIEDFMLLANKEVAKFISKKEKPEVPFVYRVHDLPDIDRLADVVRFASEFDIVLDIRTPEKIRKSLSDLTRAVRENPDMSFLEQLAIRSMAKAVYGTDNIGHYGLAFDFYTHFTSPIRRYSDVLVHRLLEKNLKGTKRVSMADLEAQCIHISKQERKAMDSERESTKYFQAVYISSYIGSEFTGRVTGMIEMGVFVEMLENRCEGMVRFDNMDETFVMAETKMKVTGRGSGTTYKMGDQVRVRVLDVDIPKRQIELEFVHAESAVN